MGLAERFKEIFLGKEGPSERERIVAFLDPDNIRKLVKENRTPLKRLSEPDDKKGKSVYMVPPKEVNNAGQLKEAYLNSAGVLVYVFENDERIPCSTYALSPEQEEELVKRIAAEQKKLGISADIQR